jgi:protein ImuB
MFACLYAFDFQVQAALLLEPKDKREALRRSPVVILDGPASLLKVVALNDAARDIGLKLGMTKLQVESCNGVSIRKQSATDEEHAQDLLIECACNFSPRVESTSFGTAILDLAGTEKLLGTFEKVACKIAVVATQAGFHLRIAIASNPDAALYAARGFTGIKVIAEGDEAKELASLSVSVLPTTPELVEILEAWGIHTFQSLAALPSIALVERLGQAGLMLQKLAQGRLNRPLRIAEASPDFVESYEFDDPIETLESLAFVLNRLLQQLCARLAFSSLATNELRLTLDLEVRTKQEKVGEQYKHEWKLPVPTQDKNMLLSLVRLELETNIFAAPIRKITVEAAPIKPRTAQGNLFAPPSPEVEKLEITLARIRGVVGSLDTGGINCVGSPIVLDTYRPNAFAVQAFSCSTEAKSLSAPILTHALRVFSPA